MKGLGGDARQERSSASGRRALQNNTQSFRHLADLGSLLQRDVGHQQACSSMGRREGRAEWGAAGKAGPTRRWRCIGAGRSPQQTSISLLP